MASHTLQRLRANDGQSTGSDDNSTHVIKSQSTRSDFLGLIDIENLAKLQISISGPIGRSSTMGSPSSTGTLLLGEGGSFVVRRVSNSAFAHSLDVWDEAFDKTKGFVVVKQPSVKELGEDDFENRLYDAMMELKVSYHEPLRMHPNIVHLHSFMWDIQSNNVDALGPSLIMEYADLGTVSNFQDSERLILHSDAKLQICLDVAEGLSFLHQCGIIHGDVKCEYVACFRS
jgi:Protein kinase domain